MMFKEVLNSEGVNVLSKNKQRNVKFGNDVGIPKKCRQWRIKLFGYTLLTHNNSVCQNSTRNWNRGGNRNVLTTN